MTFMKYFNRIGCVFPPAVFLAAGKNVVVVA